MREVLSSHYAFVDVPKPNRLESFTVRTVDDWLEMLKAPGSPAMKSKRRIDFDHELSLLSGILTFYRERMNHTYVSPILKRHREDADTGRKRIRRPKDLNRRDFFLFREKLQLGKNGEIFSALATLQYFQGLRISEAAAVHWEDIRLDATSPRESRLVVSRSVVWMRSKGIPSFLQAGFKNAEANEGFKEQPLFPESYLALLNLYKDGCAGLVFQEGGEFFEYRQIEYAYNRAFKEAGLPYTATHVMRHGGTRLAYNATKDLDVAKQLLGNSDLQTVSIYAKREATALTDFANERWKDYENVVAIGRKS